MAFLVGMSGAITIFCIQTIGSVEWIGDLFNAIGGEINLIWDGVKTIGGSLGESLCQWSAKCRSNL